MPVRARFTYLYDFHSEDSFVNDGPLSYVTDSSSQGDEDEDEDEDGNEDDEGDYAGGRERGGKKRRRKGPKFEDDEDEKVSGSCGGRGGRDICVFCLDVCFMSPCLSC